jgi:hypothetical protein
MKERMWSESDKKIVESLRAYIVTMEELVEHTKRMILRISSKYELPEAQQPHVRAQD